MPASPSITVGFPPLQFLDLLFSDKKITAACFGQLWLPLKFKQMAKIQQEIRFPHAVDKLTAIPKLPRIIYKPSEPLTERKLRLLSCIAYLNRIHAYNN